MTNESTDNSAVGEALGLKTSADREEEIFDLALDLDEANSESTDQPHQHSRRRSNPWRRAVFVVPARGAAIGGVIVAIVAVTALVLVANAENAEALSTIALALAILAFVIQILVFIAQAQAASQQMVQSEQLNTQTRSLLAEVQTTARSTERLVGEQFRDLLKAFVESNEGGKLDMDTFERRLMETFERRIASREAGAQRSEATPGLGTPRAAGVARASTPVQQRRFAQARVFSTFPDEDEGKAALATLKELTADQRRQLEEYARDEARSLQRGALVGLPFGDAISEDNQALLDTSLVAKVRSQIAGTPKLIGRLTDKGRMAARILTATGELPAWLASELPFPQADTPTDDRHSRVNPV